MCETGGRYQDDAGVLALMTAMDAVETAAPETAAPGPPGRPVGFASLKVLKGTAQIVCRGGVSVCYSLTLTIHTTAAMHEHAVGITRLVWPGCSAWLRAVLWCYSARAAL